MARPQRREVFGKYGAPRFHANDEEWARLMDWHRRLYRAGYIALAWPKEWGGAGAGLVEQIVYQDEMSNRGLPPYGVRCRRSHASDPFS